MRCARSVTVRVDSGRSEVCTSRKPRCAASRSTTVRVIGPAVVLGGRQQVGGDASRCRRSSCPAGASARAARRSPAGPAPGWRPARPAPSASARCSPTSASSASVGSRGPGRTAGMSSAWKRVGALRLLQLDLQRGPAARRRRPRAGRRARCPAPAASADSTESLASRLPFSISDSADGLIAARPATSASVWPCAPPEVPQPPADGQRIGRAADRSGTSRCRRALRRRGRRPGIDRSRRRIRVAGRCRGRPWRDAWSRRGRRSPCRSVIAARYGKNRNSSR